MTILTITRESDSAGVFRRMLIQVDGKTTARLRRGATVTVDLPPGHHVVQARMDWCSSPTLTIDSDAHLDVEYPLSSIAKLFRDTGKAIRISRRA